MEFLFSFSLARPVTKSLRLEQDELVEMASLSLPLSSVAGSWWAIQLEKNSLNFSVKNHLSFGFTFPTLIKS